jgi:tetratricopeptide (TPR) repeat protein
MKRINLAALLVFVLIFALMPIAQAQTPQQTLTQYISDLQKNPNDFALRGKIIRHVQGMKQKPAIPKEVVKHEGAAEYAFKSAKNESDYLDSAKEYEKALIIAPWLARDYFNCGVAYEKAGSFKEAINYFNFYLIAAPDARDGDAVHKRIGGLEYADKKAAKESSPAAMASKKSQEFDEWLKKLDGARYTRSFWDDDSRTTITYAIDIKGKTLVETTNAFKYREWGKNFSFEIPAREFVRRNGNYNDKYTISEETIIEISLLGESEWESTFVYRRVR